MNDIEVTRLLGSLEGVLQTMVVTGPTDLERYLRFHLEMQQVTADIEGAVTYIFSEILSGPTNSPGHAMFAHHLRTWDAVSEGSWVEATGRLSTERRSLICRKLKLDPGAASLLLERIPIARPFDSAILIATDHEEWYTELRKYQSGTFYWRHYKSYLHQQGGWDEAAITSLDESTDKVLRCLSDPERIEAFGVRGLVVGYVQSGKTANFTAVIAKALDAGYRLVIVLAGVLDSLRFQTQRRLDKELIGREQILRDQEEGRSHEYSGDQDWDKFAEYGAPPSELGAFDIRRITTSTRDYQKLGQGRDVLRFEKRYADRPLNNADNLRTTTARMVVIKKHPAVISKLMNDIKGLKVSLDEIPVLIIDDESDQASVNTIDPKRKNKGGKADKDRTATNKSIVDLLGMFSRAQYVGYTATPAANTLINPGDAEDLFPRDFIELLPRPVNYMGVSDFHDFDEEFNPLDDTEIKALGLHSNENAFVRRIEDIDDEKIFREALDAFFLGGAIKLFRADKDSRVVNTRHHTMLVHRATSQDAHDEDRNLVIALIEKNAYRKKSSHERLWKLWEKDFAPVSAAQEPHLAVPASLDELRPFLDRAFEKFSDAKKQVLVVNGHEKHRDDMPDFDKENVWNILVGGAKLSRGYTVEGLTVSYFLRRAAASDTLMQMGRWFGFRRGYRDLVRLYIATKVAAGKKGTADLYEMFESICMDEERFRKRIAIYSREGIKPIQVPPLVPMGMLLPTQKNKMYNAEIQMENFGGKVAESGRVTFAAKDRRWNAERLAALLSDSNVNLVELFGLTKDGARRVLTGHAFGASADAFLSFIQSYRWGTQQSQFSSVVGFLGGGEIEDPEIDSWLVAVLANPSANNMWTIGGLKLGVFERSVVNERFKVFSESRHRDVANHLCLNKSLMSPNSALRALTKKKQGVCLVYPVVPNGYAGKATVPDSEVTLGLSLIFPKNSMRQTMNWRVVDPSRSASLLIDQP